MLAVVALHTTPFERLLTPIGDSHDAATWVNQLARFAVPFFFVMSGYFWASKFAAAALLAAPTRALVRRIAIVFAVWSLFYLLPTDLGGAFAHGPLGPLKTVYWNLAAAARDPLATLFGGTKNHLWFLPALLSCLAISALLLRFTRPPVLVATAVVLYTIGLAGKAYADSPIGFHSGFNLRNGPFFGLLFFVTGYLLQRWHAERQAPGRGLALIVVGLAVQAIELQLIRQHWGSSMNQDYVVGTYFLGVGAALLALSNARWLSASGLAAAGPLALGIYVLHYAFVDLLAPLDRLWPEHALWDVVYVVAVLLLSWWAAAQLARHPATRRWVS